VCISTTIIWILLRGKTVFVISLFLLLLLFVVVGGAVVVVKVLLVNIVVVLRQTRVQATE
jgi:hypothetical protein